jgi:hypothetical protein
MDHDDILHLEALEFMRQASDELLQLANHHPSPSR